MRIFQKKKNVSKIVKFSSKLTILNQILLQNRNFVSLENNFKFIKNLKFRFRLPKDVSVFTMSNHTSFFDGFLASHILGWRKIRTLSGAPRDFWSRFDYFSTKSIQNHVFQISSQNYFFFFDWLEIQKSRFRYTCVWTYSRPCRWRICPPTAIVFDFYEMLWNFSGTLYWWCPMGGVPNQERFDEGWWKNELSTKMF